MKALSLLQPWASLIVLGDKQIETRSWNTKHRGQLLIHASKKYTKEQDQLAHHFFQMTGHSKVYHNHRGYIIGIVKLERTFPTEAVKAGAYGSNSCVMDGKSLKQVQITQSEESFGDYSPGRYGWLLANPILFPEPVPCKGSLSIWNIPEELIPEISCQIQLAKDHG